MRSDRDDLIKEFPELASNELTLEKEIFAHFGLAFMKFALVEHSLINVITFHKSARSFIAGSVKNAEEWERLFDQSFEFAKKQTFGNMVKIVAGIGEFANLAANLTEIKKLRDYFAHHLMRDEAIYFSSEEGCWLLLAKISEVRKKTLSIESDLKPRFDAMCQAYRYRLPSDSQLQAALGDWKVQVATEIAAGAARVGWEKDAL